MMSSDFHLHHRKKPKIVRHSLLRIKKIYIFFDNLLQVKNYVIHSKWHKSVLLIFENEETKHVLF